MKCRHAVAAAAEAQGQSRHAEHRAPAVIGGGQCIELILFQAQFSPDWTEAFLDQLDTEAVVACCYRRVQRAHGGGGARLLRLLAIKSHGYYRPSASLNQALSLTLHQVTG